MEFFAFFLTNISFTIRTEVPMTGGLPFTFSNCKALSCLSNFGLKLPLDSMVCLHTSSVFRTLNALALTGKFLPHFCSSTFQNTVKLRDRTYEIRHSFSSSFMSLLAEHRCKKYNVSVRSH